MKSLTGGLIFRHSRCSELAPTGSPIALVKTLSIRLRAVAPLLEGDDCLNAA
jgi:hypothetical protein